MTIGGRRSESGGIESITDGDLHPVPPGLVVEFVGTARQQAHLVTGLQQAGYEAASDVPGCSGDEDPHCRASVGKRRGYARRPSVALDGFR